MAVNAPVPVVRDRRPEDLSVLLPMLERTHQQVGYPVRAAAVRADWLASPDELDAAVAVAGERIVGHVALHVANTSRWSSSPTASPAGARRRERGGGRLRSSPWCRASSRTSLCAAPAPLC